MLEQNNTKPQSSAQTQIVIFITVLFGFISYSLPYPIFSPLFLSSTNGILPHHYTEVERTFMLGVAIVLYPLGQFLGNPWLGQASDRYGRKKLLMLSLAAVGISDVLIGFGISQQNLWLVMISLFLGGFCAANTTIAQSTAADLNPTAQAKTKSFGLITVAINIGWILGVLIGGKLADDTLVHWFNYATPFYFSALCYGLNLLMVWIAFPKIEPRPQNKSDKTSFYGSFFAQLKKKNLRVLYFYSFLSFLASYYFFCFFAVFMVQKFNFGPSQIANFEAYLALPLIAASYLITKVIPQVGLTKTSYLSHFALGISLIIFLIPASYLGLWYTVPLVAIWICFAEITTGLLISNAVPSEEQGIAMGTYRSLLVLGELVAALTGGYLAGLHQNFPFYAGAVVAMLAGIVLVGWSYNQYPLQASSSCEGRPRK